MVHPSFSAREFSMANKKFIGHRNNWCSPACSISHYHSDVLQILVQLFQCCHSCHPFYVLVRHSGFFPAFQIMYWVELIFSGFKTFNGSEAVYKVSTESASFKLCMNQLYKYSQSYLAISHKFA